MTASPTITLRFPDSTTAAFGERLVAILSEYDLIAIHEDDLNEPRVWTAHFGSAASRDQALAALADDPEFAAIDARATEIEDEDMAVTPGMTSASILTSPTAEQRTRRIPHPPPRIPTSS